MVTVCTAICMFGLALGKVGVAGVFWCLARVSLCLEIMELLYINIEIVGAFRRAYLTLEMDHAFLKSYWSGCVR